MPKKISKKQKEDVVCLLMEGNTMTEIAEKTGVSYRSIKRIKNELTESNPELAQILHENKCNTTHRKREEKYLLRIKNEQHLFEDVEEGWIYHMTAAEMRTKQSSKWWSFIAYPESAGKNWKEQLQLMGCELAISPLHDKDLWAHDSPEIVDEETGEIIEPVGSRYKSGERKKAHWHCIVKFERTMSYREANDLIRDITNGPYVQKCYSIKGQYEYFIHMNNPEKYQYEKDEIERYNGFTIETTQSDRIVMTDEIGRVIAENEMIDLEQIRKYYEGQYEYINVISLKSYYFEKLTQCNYRKLYPEGRVQQVRIVKDKEK